MSATRYLTSRPGVGFSSLFLQHGLRPPGLPIELCGKFKFFAENRFCVWKRHVGIITYPPADDAVLQILPHLKKTFPILSIL